MVKTIYVDVLFLVNLIINYLILFSCTKIGAFQFSRFRLFIGALLGAIWSICIFIPELTFLASPIFKIAISALICILALGTKQLIRKTLLFLAISFAFGGVVFAASLLGLKSFCEVRGGVYYIHLSLPALLLSAVAAHFLLSLIFRRAAVSSDKKISEVTIKNGDAEIKLSTLHDTGNSLRDPSTNAPVVISDYQSVRTLFPESVQKILDGTSSDFFHLALDSLSDFGQFKLIPYKTVGISFALMLAFAPEEITLNKKIIPKALLAISSSRVSDGGAYSAII